MKGVHPGMSDANHLYQTIFRRIASDPASNDESILVKENS